MGQSDPRRIVVVGPCAAGKTTLVAALQARGFRAMACGQEHSEIRTLWRRTMPDIVIALDLDLATLRRRRGYAWPEQLYAAQRRRLAPAMTEADVVIDTSSLSADAVLGKALAFLAASATEGE